MKKQHKEFEIVKCKSGLRKIRLKTRFLFLWFIPTFTVKIDVHWWQTLTNDEGGISLPYLFDTYENAENFIKEYKHKINNDGYISWKIATEFRLSQHEHFLKFSNFYNNFNHEIK